MNKLNTSGISTFSEVNLKLFFQKVYDYKLHFLFSLALCMGLAYGFLKIASPIYEVQSTVLIDAKDITRMNENSKYVDGGLSLAEAEKNIFNEIGLLKSYKLIERTIEELDLRVSYHAGNWPAIQEYFGSFPFKVSMIDGANQLPDTRFQIELINDNSFRLLVNVKKPTVAQPKALSKLEINQPLEFSKTYQFGDTIAHEYFSFIVSKPDVKILSGQFEGQELFFETHLLKDIATAYLNEIDVEQADIQSSIIQVSSKGNVPEKEILIVNKLIDNYIKTKSKKRDDLVSNKEDFIRKQLETVTQDLAEAEKSMEVFKKGANAVDLKKSASISLDRLERLESEKEQIELNIEYYFSLLKYLGESENFDKIIAPSVVGINDPLLNENLLELKRLNSERTKLQYYKGEESYDLEILDKQIRGTAITLQENLKNLMASAKLALKDKNKRIAKLEKTLDVLPGNEQKLVNFERKTNLYENLFNYLNQELAKTEIASAKQMSDTQVLDEARIMGGGPVFPSPLLIMALAAILGFLFPMAWIVVADSFNEQIASKTELQAHSNITVAATIAHLPKHSLFFADKAKWLVEESFRDLAANLNFLVPDRSKNVIGMSSLMAGEGKTFCAINLAMTLASAGKQVLLIDTDFRKPSLLNADGSISKKAGLSDYLKDDLFSIDSIIQDHPSAPNLQYIPTKMEEGNPQELFLNSKMEILIKAVKHEYDYVIIDSPAVGLVSDYLLISRLIDVHLFVLRRNFSKTAFISEYEDLKAKGNMEHTFFVLNDVPRANMKYGKSYYKGSSKESKAVIVRSINP